MGKSKKPYDDECLYKKKRDDDTERLNRNADLHLVGVRRGHKSVTVATALTNVGRSSPVEHERRGSHVVSIQASGHLRSTLPADLDRGSRHTGALSVGVDSVCRERVGSVLLQVLTATNAINVRPQVQVVGRCLTTRWRVDGGVGSTSVATSANQRQAGERRADSGDGRNVHTVVRGGGVAVVDGLCVRVPADRRYILSK